MASCRCARDTTVTVRLGGVILAARSSVCWNMERVPTKEQYCFGLGWPSQRYTKVAIRPPSPPANTIDQVRSARLPPSDITDLPLLTCNNPAPAPIHYQLAMLQLCFALLDIPSRCLPDRCEALRAVGVGKQTLGRIHVISCAIDLWGHPAHAMRELPDVVSNESANTTDWEESLGHTRLLCWSKSGLTDCLRTGLFKYHQSTSLCIASNIRVPVPRLCLSTSRFWQSMRWALKHSHCRPGNWRREFTIEVVRACNWDMAVGAGG